MRRKTVVRNFQNMMLVLFEVAVNFEFLSNDDVGGVFKVFQDTSSQQAQAERMITIWRAGGFDFGMCSFDFLFAEELDHICFLHSGEFIFPTAKHEFPSW